MTRERVIAAARELSYRASPHATGLASGRTTTVAVVVAQVSRWHFVGAIAGAAEVLERAGYNVLLYHLANTPARRRFFTAMPLQRRVDGVLVLSGHLGDDEVSVLRDVGVPLVTLGMRVPSTASVRIDDVAVMRTAVNHLRHLGHERITMIADASDDHDVSPVSSRARPAGYIEAMQSAGLDQCIDLLATPMSGVKGGAWAAIELMQRRDLPSAVVAESDELAAGTFQVLRSGGIAIPERLSVMGIGDQEMASVMDLTTVSQPVHQQGERAAELLLSLLGPSAVPNTDLDVVMQTRLVPRGSTAAAQPEVSQGPTPAPLPT